MEVKINKVFKDKETKEDIYLISIYVNGQIHNIPVTKNDYSILLSTLRNLSNELN